MATNTLKKNDRLAFKKNDRVVYPTHGVGVIIGEEAHSIGGIEMKMLIISFPKDKMILRVPSHRAKESGLRALSSEHEMQEVIENVLKSRPRSSKGMWSKRQQEYDIKINSGSISAVAEVVRDLYKNSKDDRSYSERTIYESALMRLASEYAAIKNIEVEEAIEFIVDTVEQKEAA